MINNNSNIKVIGIPLYKHNKHSAIDTMVNLIKYKDKENRCVSATGAHGLVIANKNKNFKILLNKFYMNLPDGMPGVWVGRAKGAKKMDRCYGPDFFALLMQFSADTNIKHFLCGGMEGVADKLLMACEEKFGNNNIVGTYCPPFKKVDEYDYNGIAKIINDSKADIVWVGISTPKQEQFAWRLSKYTNVHFIITVGAAFDFHIGNVKQAPKWVQNSGLEWFFRLVMEPKRLYKRYFEIVPKFIYYGLLDVLKYRLNNKRG